MDFQLDLKNIKWQRGFRDLPEAYIRLKTPGVVTIINDMLPNPELEAWKAEVGEEAAEKIMKASHERGTSMHLFIETFLNEMRVSGDPSLSLKKTQTETPILLEKEQIPPNKIKEGRDLFYNFYDSDYVSDYVKILGTETNIYHPQLFYRGKIDWLFTIRPWGIGIRDFKGSSSPIKKGSRKEEGYKYQLGAYTAALEGIYQDRGEKIKVGYASIVNMSTSSKLIQNIECFGDELEEYKKKFETIAAEWHKINGQGFLLK